MLDERILSLIREFNPWWEGKKVPQQAYRRVCFEKIQKYMPTKQIIALVGLRRVGKTVLMQQNIHILLDNSPPKNVFYFLFDEFGAKKPELLEELLEHYLKTIALDGKKYIFLDEIQKVPYWQDILKRFYDTRTDVKFIISGSSSMNLKKSGESLAGRIFDIQVPVLLFREFIGMNQMPMDALDLSQVKRFYLENLHNRQIYDSLLSSYIYKGAFPELVSVEDPAIIQNYIKSSVIEKILYEDMPEVFQIRRKDVLFSILEYCCRETSSLLDITSLGNLVGANYETTRSYVFYLSNSFMLDLAYNYSKNASKLLRKAKKVHIAHPAFSIAIMKHSKESVAMPELSGKFTETVVFQHVKQANENVMFWRSPQKDEVDIVVASETVLPIEVKFQKSISGGDYAAILKFMKKQNIKEGILLTRDRMDEIHIDGMRIMLIPVWLYLLTF